MFWPKPVLFLKDMFNSVGAEFEWCQNLLYILKLDLGAPGSKPTGCFLGFGFFFFLISDQFMNRCLLVIKFQ